MSEYDLKLDIPALAYMNAQLLSPLEQGGTAFEAKKKLFSQEHYVNAQLDPYNFPLFNHSLIISVLFNTVVVPREFLDLPMNHGIYSGFDADKVTRYFDVKKPEAVDSQLLIRCLRNSIAHALFSITQSPSGEVQYRFWTEREPIFEATATQGDLVKFVSIVGQRLANAVLQHKIKGTAT